jgi:hypothetical protein
MQQYKRISALIGAHSQKVGSSFQNSLTAWSFNSRRLGNLDKTSYFLGMRPFDCTLYEEVKHR